MLRNLLTIIFLIWVEQGFSQLMKYEQIDLQVQNKENQAAIASIKSLVSKKGSSFPYFQAAKIYQQESEQYIFSNPEKYIELTDSADLFYSLSIKYLTHSEYKKFLGYFARELQKKAPSIQDCRGSIEKRQLTLRQEVQDFIETNRISNQIKNLYLNEVDIFNNLLKTNMIYIDFLLTFEDSNRLFIEELIEQGEQLKSLINAYNKKSSSGFKRSFRFVLVEKLELLKNVSEQFDTKNVVIYDFASWGKTIKELLAKVPLWKRSFAANLQRLNNMTDSLVVGRTLQSSVENDAFIGLCVDLLSVDPESYLVQYLNFKRDNIELLAYHNDFYSLATDPRTEESYRSRLIDILQSQSNLVQTRLDSLLRYREKSLSYESIIEYVFGSLSRFYEILETESNTLESRASRLYQSNGSQASKGFYGKEAFEINGLIHFTGDTVYKNGFYLATHAVRFDKKGHILAGHFYNQSNRTFDAFVCSMESPIEFGVDSTAKVFWIRKFSFYIEKKSSQDKILCLSINEAGYIAISILASSADDYESRLIILDAEGQIMINQEVTNNGIIREVRAVNRNEFVMLVSGKGPNGGVEELEKYRYLKVNTKGEIIFQNVFSVNGNVCGFFTHSNGAYIFINFLEYIDNRYNRVFGLRPYFRTLLLDVDQGGFIRKSHLLFDGKSSFVFEVEKNAENQFYTLVTHEVKDKIPAKNSVSKSKQGLVF